MVRFMAEPALRFGGAYGFWSTSLHAMQALYQLSHCP